MEQTILTSEQRAVLDLVRTEPLLGNFYLTGGTALAEFYLRHRFSDDLDFFSFDEPDGLFLHKFADKIKQELGVKNYRFERLYDRNQFFFSGTAGRELKVEFTKYPFKELERPLVRESLRIDSLRDIAANKIMAMLDRFEPKDFADLYFILQNFRLDDVRLDAEKKFGIRIESIFLGGELAKAKRVEALPKMLKKVTVEELKSFFSGLAQKLGPDILTE